MGGEGVLILAGAARTTAIMGASVGAVASCFGATSTEGKERMGKKNTVIKAKL